jgi:ActR/RegA family two-component response regulator
MADRRSDRLKGRCLLLVEDEYLIAADLARSLEHLGVEVIGPAASVEHALELVESEGDRLDGAVLDINLRDELVYPVADALAARGVPFVFTTGYDAVAIPNPYARAPRCEKPVDQVQLVRCLSTA